ncbi:(d)CMP kinase [Morganella morganii subsp. morganii]|uniref:shikimate kinase n=1 Tax=Morganella morganii TaxID=582 RepID=UPI0011400BEB|nr:shikimate kinase [Morganella morganii]ELJ5777154.1 (d)CMP kinase [Morganella morganii]MBT0352896.1 (d)CMP kinase [Morganella morganii subsp. morganii]TPW54715.1 hypothetical protein DL503_13980 [Morganella morganii]
MSITIRGEDATCLFEILSDPKTIFIEGHTGAGKTTVGKKIAEKLGAKFFDTDSYVVKGSASDVIKQYENMVDIEKLSKELMEEKGKKVIVGICLRKILKLPKILEGAIFIYIKCVSRTLDQWIEESILEDLREGIEDINYIPEPHASDYRYILEFNPQYNADIVFERLEENI